MGTSREALESEIQTAYFDWLKTVPATAGHSLRDYAYAVPNGIFVPGSPQRTARIIAAMKRQGLTSGVSDVVIALPRGPHHGAYIELKRIGENPTGGQISWLTLVANVGYFAACARGLEAAQEVTLQYLAGKMAGLSW